MDYRKRIKYLHDSHFLSCCVLRTECVKSSGLFLLVHLELNVWKKAVKCVQFGCRLLQKENADMCTIRL